MSGIQRRQFLQFSGATLASLGLSNLAQTQRTMAQKTPRKRALLVGINRYNDRKWMRLEGAENDVELQRHLLLHRFGFTAENIKVLVGREATHDGILAAFKTFLGDWAEPGDVVVFHFSGHGSTVYDPENALGTGLVSTIVPVDSMLPNQYPNAGGEVNDITGHTLWLLMRSLKTENVTFLLDSCHSGGARKGLIRLRARPGEGDLQKPGVHLVASAAQQAVQKQLMQELGIENAAALGKLRQSGVPQGILLSAAQADQSAIDASFGDTSAGVFTYVLTRYLWQQAGQESITQVMEGTIATTERLLQTVFSASGAVQRPLWNMARRQAAAPVYFMNGRSGPAEAVITQVKGDQVDLFLGGIDPKSLEAFGPGATFTLAKGQGQVVVESRDQFRARGRWVAAGQSVAVGATLQERSRAIPADLTLRLGVDESLGADRSAAETLLRGIARIEVVATTDQALHYVLRREGGAIGLWSPGLELLPGSAGEARESIELAVKRLQPKLKALLAARLVRLTLNVEASRLNVAAAMQAIDGQLAAEAFTVRGGRSQSLSQSRGLRAPAQSANRLKPGTAVQFLIRNHEARAIYASVLLIGVDGSLAVLSPLPGAEDGRAIAPGQEIQVPDPQAGELYRFKVGQLAGHLEVLVIASFSPLKRSIELLRALATEPNQVRGRPVTLSQPDQAVRAMLQDLDGGDGRSIDTRQIAALSITFEILE